MKTKTKNTLGTASQRALRKMLTIPKTKAVPATAKRKGKSGVLATPSEAVMESSYYIQAEETEKEVPITYVEGIVLMYWFLFITFEVLQAIPKMFG